MRVLPLLALPFLLSCPGLHAQDEALDDVVDPGFERARMSHRNAIIGRSAPTPLEKEANNPYIPAGFLDMTPDEITTNIVEHEAMRAANLGMQTWSGFFWPNYLGGLGYRYNDGSFPRGDWAASRAYVARRPTDQVPNELLSPSEKYDLVMGITPESPDSLTAKQWNLGRAEYNDTGNVETWQGICHGWAPAAVNFVQPVRSVTFSTRRGNIRFTPDDVKALGALLYANGRAEMVFAGVRCYTDEPTADRQGRVTNPECFDMNPADWHLIITHQIARKRQAFVMDVENSRQVWNKPVVGYSFQWFNIGNGRDGTLAQSMRTAAEARRYRYGSYRNPNTAYVVGVRMETIYLDGAPVGSTGYRTKTATYHYDLELDARQRIVGGEWRGNKHPDFAWKPKVVRLPTTDGDPAVAGFNPWELVVTPGWREAALNSIRHGAPLMKFVKYLFDYTGWQSLDGELVENEGSGIAAEDDTH